MFFGKNIKYLRVLKGLNQDEMQAGTGIRRATWSNYENGDTEPNLETLNKISEFFRMPIDDLLKKDLQVEAIKGNLIDKGQVAELSQKGNLKGNPKRNLNADISLSVVMEEGAEYGNLGVIPITDISVAAGTGMFNEHHTENLEYLKLPSSLVKRGASYISVIIKGPSMSPTLQDGGYVVIRLLDRSEWAKMPDERIYVVADRDGKSYLKRVKNRFKQGFIVLKSDNPDQASFPNFNLKAEEINSIWYAEWYFTAKMPNVHDQFYSRLQRLEDRFDELTTGKAKINP